ncbi:MAG: hypothetical protein JW774_00615 [Candidatus Aureabacteria bacterium]|nr:hypothetical protein [Candidatus Auribacterota bacterium]
MTIEKALQMILPEPQQNGPGGIVFDLCFPADFPAFSGHFPDEKILPAVVQVMSIKMMMEKVTRATLCVRAVSKARFKNPVLPDQTLRISCIPVHQDETVLVSVKITDMGTIEKSRFELACTTTNHSKRPINQRL